MEKTKKKSGWEVAGSAGAGLSGTVVSAWISAGKSTAGLRAPRFLKGW